ncbi:MAG: hypothetical protein DWQ07_19950 [Chloroflexi bacterium]|nr:MAG: hypothetical protein DWQ07_19950 [Chloroflexota bacterium]MBL1194357.1 hypothetical protein [Chloroflexota bacterium]
MGHKTKKKKLEENFKRFQEYQYRGMYLQKVEILKTEQFFHIVKDKDKNEIWSTYPEYSATLSEKIAKEFVKLQRSAIWEESKR